MKNLVAVRNYSNTNSKLSIAIVQKTNKSQTLKIPEADHMGTRLVFPTHFNPNNSLLISLQISLLLTL